jgi:hypothetical protein
MPNQYNVRDLTNVPAGNNFTGYDPIGPSGTIRAFNSYSAAHAIDDSKFSSVSTQVYPHATGSYSAGEYLPTDNGPVSGVYAPGSGVSYVSDVRMVHAGGAYVEYIRWPGYIDGTPLYPSGASFANLTITKYNNSINADPFLDSSV